MKPGQLLWLGLGLAMVALGAIGALLPVMPTTVFLILALACFSRSSPRLEAWLLNHATFGAPLRQWREQGAISRKGKALAGTGMAAGYGLYLWTAAPHLWVALGVGLALVASLAYVWSRPQPRDAARATSSAQP